MDVEGQRRAIRRLRAWGLWFCAAGSLGISEFILLLVIDRFRNADLSLSGLILGTAIFTVALLGFFWFKAKAGWSFLR